MTKMKLAIIILVALWVILPLLVHKGQEKLKVVQSPPGSTTVNVFTAGIFNQPKGAFEFILDHPTFEGETIVFVPYDNNGMNLQEIYDAVEELIVCGDYEKVRFFGISLGTKVGHHFAVARANKEAGFEPDTIINFDKVAIECYDINPCWAPDLLKPSVWAGLSIGDIPLTAIELALGPISLVPCIKQSGEWFSLRLIMDQLRCIAYGPISSYLNDDPDALPEDSALDDAEVIRAVSSTVKVVIASDMDEFLDNEAVLDQYDEYYTGKIVVETHHGDTIGAGAIYREALEPFLEER